MIEIKNLSKAYGKHQVLDNISLRFSPGRIYGIVGRNGAGKTTLFRCLAGLESCLGKVESDFHPLKDHLGFLPTQPYLFDRITGAEYLRLHALARGIEIGDLSARNIFDLPLHQYAGTYSTGMQKKLALLAILLQKNEVLILDEPYNGVDIQSNILITEIIHELKRLHKTVLISSHIFSTLADTCDEIHLLEDGSFRPPVLRDQFAELESEMKQVTIGESIRKLGLG